MVSKVTPAVGDWRIVAYLNVKNLVCVCVCVCVCACVCAHTGFSAPTDVTPVGNFFYCILADVKLHFCFSLRSNCLLNRGLFPLFSSSPKDHCLKMGLTLSLHSDKSSFPLGVGDADKILLPRYA